MSDTGGGHRAAADAIIEALAYSFPDRYSVTLFDVFKQAAIAPFDQVPSWYLPFTTYAEPLWHVGFVVTNNRIAERLAQPFFEAIMGRGLRQYLREQSPDLVVSTHPIFNAFGRRALRSIGSTVPFVTVVTRAVFILAIFYPLGCFLAYLGQKSIQENFDAATQPLRAASAASTPADQAAPTPAPAPEASKKP